MPGTGTGGESPWKPEASQTSLPVLFVSKRGPCPTTPCSLVLRQAPGTKRTDQGHTGGVTRSVPALGVEAYRNFTLGDARSFSWPTSKNSTVLLCGILTPTSTRQHNRLRVTQCENRFTCDVTQDAPRGAGPTPRHTRRDVNHVTHPT